jgi:hypothetical protein
VRPTTPGSSSAAEPRFTYHGFRYVEVTGYPGTPTLDSVAGRIVHADVSSTGSFSSSDPLLNQIWQNDRRTILNNSMSVPTDNPVRDERTPRAWTCGPITTRRPASSAWTASTPTTCWRFLGPVGARTGGLAGGNPGGHVATGAQAVERPGEIVGQDAEGPRLPACRGRPRRPPHG